ncbi:DNA circularisation protein N-terminus [Geoalkalibacter ferrihydriticus]|uniref:DNA circularisation protein N-terminus n=1 Tax=Geoalkalibacter ferrihydriticus TaxID=392333 RepID=A0A1G9JFT4_9BACT|nr:DNA circularization N-terminal domain-containing protein [Geoalkalibacter ferrihydriticus]SDL36105.1 DNA circularisation protein N-terminus [Geoalkalibacter ferrihydriticus]
MALRPMLDDIELQQVQIIAGDQGQALAQHRVPGLEGDFFQRMGRRASSFQLCAVLSGAQAQENLETLNDKFRAAAPVSFVADITDAVQVDEVLIDALHVRDLAGKPQRYEVLLRLREYLETQPPTTAEETFTDPAAAQATQDEAQAAGEERAEQVVTQIAAGQGDLRVEVRLEGGGDFSQLAVLVEGTSDSGEEVHFTIEEQNEGVYVRQNVPAGNYRVQAFRR